MFFTRDPLTTLKDGDMLRWTATTSSAPITDKHMKKIEMFATGDGGEGYVQSLGVYDDICEIQIRCGMFAPDTVISFELVSGKEAD